jgi:F420-dependent oxidoreductase-like protein
VKLGVNLGYWSPTVQAADQLAITIEAERLGFDSVWVAEGYGSDAVSVLTWMASHTSRIRLGTAVMQIPARTPAMTAMTAATLDQLSDGRVTLGLGSSGPQVAEGWHGQPFSGQIERTRDYIAVVRKALAGERVEHQGSAIRVPLPHGAGKPLRMMIEPAQPSVPVYLAALGPRNTELTGEIADGWLPTFFSPEHVGAQRERLQAGAARGGRSLDEFEIAPIVDLCIDDDLDHARDLLRPVLALYIGGMGSRKRNFYNRLAQNYGFADAAREVQELYLSGKVKDAAAAVPAELIDALALCGPEDRVRDRLHAYRDAGVGTLIVVPKGDGLQARLRQLDLIQKLVNRI